MNTVKYWNFYSMYYTNNRSYSVEQAFCCLYMIFVFLKIHCQCHIYWSSQIKIRSQGINNMLRRAPKRILHKNAEAEHVWSSNSQTTCLWDIRTTPHFHNHLPAWPDWNIFILHKWYQSLHGDACSVNEHRRSDEMPDLTSLSSLWKYTKFLYMLSHNTLHIKAHLAKTNL